MTYYYIIYDRHKLHIFTLYMIDTNYIFLHFKQGGLFSMI